jgi:glucose-6-phosphate 1-dehydrogenase
VQPLIDAWAADRGPISTYPSGSQGPAAADALIERSGRAWRPVDLPPELRS